MLITATYVRAIHLAVAAGMAVAMPQACANANPGTMVQIVMYCAMIESIAVGMDDAMSCSRD